MRSSTLPFSLAALAAAICAPGVRAQWVSFDNQTTTRLVAANSLGAGDQQEKDYAWADLDNDGDIDLVCVRKEPFTTGGHFPNVLFMNENGVLTDRSAALTSATVPGSNGFLDATNDRDVVICDVDGDTWLDVVTCTTLTATMPKYIRVPRVYLNRGNDGQGNWLGLLYDDPNRIDDAPWGGHHRFCSVAAGDVDGDGDVDLYFGDYQQGGPRPNDINDRLLINDGTGYFTDESAARMTPTMLESSFGMKVDIVDMNGDGKLDIVKDDALNAPQAVSISYNDTATHGVFGSYQLAYQNQPYHFNIGDLNNDNRPDMIVSDDGQDQYLFNLGNQANGTVNWSPTYAFSYSGGGDDDGFGGNNLIVDLDNDGWNDAIIADVDVDIEGCARRCHIYRNLGNAPNVTLQEQIVNGQVVGGITTAALRGTFDVAVFDIDGDGFKDMVVGRCTGTEVYINTPPSGISFSYVNGLPGSLVPNLPTDLVVDVIGVGGLSPVPGTGVLHYAVDGGAFSTIAMSDNGVGRYSATLPAFPCPTEVSFYLSVQASDSSTYFDPPSAPAGYYDVGAWFGSVTFYENDFETDANGWTVVNGAGLVTGGWERADPNGTIASGKIAAPFSDAQAGAADFCFVTEDGPAGAVTTPSIADVDGGPTDLISPPLDYAGTDGTISFQAWVFSAGNDGLEIAVSGDGTNWVTVQTIAADINSTPGNTNQWLQYGFRVSDFIAPTATVQVRFRASDTAPEHIVEMGLDVFRAQRFVCDYCQPQFALQTIGNATLSMCGGVLSPGDPFTTLRVEDMPAFGNGLLFFDALPFPVPSPWNSAQLISPAPIVLGPLFADANGDVTAPLFLGGILPAGWSLYVQTAYSDATLPGQVGVTNALQVTWN